MKTPIPDHMLHALENGGDPLIFADWLEENGHDNLAANVREWAEYWGPKVAASFVWLVMATRENPHIAMKILGHQSDKS